MFVRGSCATADPNTQISTTQRRVFVILAKFFNNLSSGRHFTFSEPTLQFLNPLIDEFSTQMESFIERVTVRSFFSVVNYVL